MLKRKSQNKPVNNIISSRKVTITCPNCGKQHEVTIHVPMLHLDGSPACSMEKCMEALTICNCGLLCGLHPYSPDWLQDAKYRRALQTPDATLRKISLLDVISGNPSIIAYYINYYHQIGDSQSEALMLRQYIHDLIEYDYCVYLEIPANSIVSCPMDETTFVARDLLIDAYRRAGDFQKAKQLVDELEKETHKLDEMYKWLKKQKKLIAHKNQSLI
jgi:pentatricopeptide repeat protein